MSDERDKNRRKLILPGTGYDQREADLEDPEREVAIVSEIGKKTFGVKPASVCTVPVGNGELCLHPFFEGEDERNKIEHIRKCAAEHEQVIHEEHERLHPSILKPWDTEYAEWVEANKDAILDGRMSAF